MALRDRLELSFGTGWRRGTVIVVCGLFALTAVAGAAGTPGAARDQFTGRVTSGMGAYAGDRGSLSVRLAPGQAAGTSRRLALTLAPLSCRPGGRGCLGLRGVATGSMLRIAVGIRDVGQTLRLKATGRVSPIGWVVVTGTVRTVGFVARGRETLRLILSGRRGSVTVTAASALVPGFTAP